MKSHDISINQIQALVDNELSGNDREALLTHLESCNSCRNAFEEEKMLSDRIRRARYLTPAPESLRERIIRDMNAAANSSSASPFAKNSVEVIRPKSSFRFGWKPLAIAAMLCILVGGTISVWQARRTAHATPFIEAAIADHRKFDDASLDVRSSSPAVVAAWFAQRVSFPFRMPNSGMASDDRAKYTLAGGRLVDFGGQRAALLTFELSNDRITLLVSSDKLAKATGGKVTHSDGLLFHAMNMNDLHVATWDNKGLTYALVSPIAMGSTKSCSTCHRDSSANVAGVNKVPRTTAEKWTDFEAPEKIALLEAKMPAGVQ